MADKTVIGIIGGSGVYEIDGLADTRWVTVNSPFGAPSDDLLCGTLEGVAVVFLPRHGRGHRIPPSALNARANIDALKRAGVTEILSVSAVGSLREHLAPGTFVIVDQFIDRTFARVKSFFDTGLVAHVGFGHPVCPRLGGCAGKNVAGHECSPSAGRHVSCDGGAAVFHPRRIESVPVMGMRRDRHDEHAGGQTRPRGRTVLRHRWHGDRL